MHQRSTGVSRANAGAGLYLYCVANSPERVALGRIGLGGATVYTKPCRDICAVVHCGGMLPYTLNDRQVAEEWMLTHHRVVETALGLWGTVLPSSFNTIFLGGDAGRRVEEWLEAEYHTLKARIERVWERAEYAVHVCWNPAAISRSLARSDGESVKLKAEIASTPGDTAYLHRERLKDMLRGELTALATRCFQDFYERIRKQVDDLRVERTRSVEDGRQMLMSISCLATREQARALGQTLDGIGAMEGIFLNFTGPWPPYSFVGNPE